MSLEINNHFVCRFYLCIWNKDDPHSQEKIIYYLARLKSKEILRDSGNGLLISRDWAKKICLALGQKNSFSRGFDKILGLLLVCACFFIRCFSLYVLELIPNVFSGLLERKFSCNKSKGFTCGELCITCFASFSLSTCVTYETKCFASHIWHNSSVSST